MRTRKALPVVTACAFLLVPGAGRAAVVIMHDGFLLQGDIRQQIKIETDPSSGQAVPMPTGFYVVNDTARRVFFAHSQVGQVDEDVKHVLDTLKLETRVSRYLTHPMCPVDEILSISPWKNLEREFELNSVRGRLNIQQRLVSLTPRYARVDALRYNWSEYYLTSEFSAETVTKLLSSFPDLKDRRDLSRRMRAFDFLAQASLYDAAQEELQAIERDFPDSKDKIEGARERLQKLRTLQRFEEVERAFKAGRHRWVQEQIRQFPREGLEEKLLAHVRELRARYEAANEGMANARRFLKELPPKLGSSAHRQLFAEAAAAILVDLDLDDFLTDPDQAAVNRKSQRLEPFVTLALQAERDLKQGRSPDNGPEQLLSLAVSGWFLGKHAADTKIDLAQRVWKTRQFVLKYQKSRDGGDRKDQLTAYEKNKNEAVAIDEMAQLIAYLPPPEPDAQAGGEPVEVQPDVPGSRNKSSYLLQLPLEYRHARGYPVLIVLHHGGGKPKDVLGAFSSLATRSGYILAAPEWNQGVNDYYSYSPEEHASVLDTLRDLVRRFQVDTDRVFLFGFGLGGDMAFDVGLAHPDLFAGVMTMAGAPHLFASRYWHNGQNLPFYMVDGDHSGVVFGRNYGQCKQWLPRGYPAVHAVYRGRGFEWFGGELPALFDWMDHKRDRFKRARAVPDLGKSGNGGPFGEEYQTMRQTDSRFYWLSTEAVADGNINDPRKWNNAISTATLQGRTGEGNQISVNVRGLKQVTVWLARDMVDFSKPVTVRVNGSAMWTNRKVVPSMETMLEDLYLRGDRQRLFLARIEFNRL